LLLSYGLFLLFVVVAGESAGVPLPGETGLIAAAILATPAQHHYDIKSVIAVAAAGAIVGDNIGYWLGRVGGRRLLERWRPIRRYAERVLPPGERFFAKHGGKTVFFGRFIAVLRVSSAWLAGIVWATGVGLLAYYFGKAAADAISRYGLYGAAVAIVLAALVFLGIRHWHKRMER
jgi:membrane protein DedA with SNARE-associated domain